MAIKECSFSNLAIKQEPNLYPPSTTAVPELKVELKSKLESKLGHIKPCQDVKPAVQSMDSIGIITVNNYDQREYGCPYYPCTQAYSGEPELRDHMKLHQNTEQYECAWPNCGLTLPRNDDVTVTQHTLSHICGTPPIPPVVDACDSSNDQERYEENDNLYQCPTTSELYSIVCADGPDVPEQQQPTEIQLYDCDTCGEQFTSDHQRRQHYIVESDNLIQLFRCCAHGCNRRFSALIGLNAHQRMLHVGEKPYRCTEEGCVEAFKFRSLLERHKHNHSAGIRFFKCPLEGCGKVFDHVGHLKKHKRTHRIECSWEGCKASFLCEKDLTAHQESHTRKRCSRQECGMTFKTKYQLSQHNKLFHSDEAVFTCDWEGCERRFCRQNGLARHKRYHTGNKPFACPWDGCKETFVRKWSMVRHAGRHSREKT